MRITSNLQVLLAGLATIRSGADAFVYRGVNLGGWLVTEPWMNAILYNSTGAIDEWGLCSTLGKDDCLKLLQNHWSTFITRDDFVQIQQAGLRYAVRIPFGHWAVDVADYEPYVQGQYPYLQQAVQWAKEFNLKVFIDMHGAPGSQNGWEESGRQGPLGFNANQTNTDRLMKVLTNLTSEFTKSEYGGAVTNIEPLNEPTLSYDYLRTFYTAAANVIGAGNSSGINITISDGFFNPHSWVNYNPWDSGASSPAQHLTVDTHQFWAFAPFTDLNSTQVLDAICGFAKSQITTGAEAGTPPTLVGEWSLSTGVTANSTTDAYGDVNKRTWFRTLFEAQAAAFTPNAAGQPSIGWFFWSWKTQYDIDAWSYSKGLAQGYIPSNVSNHSTFIFPIREADGCIDYTAVNYTAPVLSSSTSGSSSTTTTTSSSGSSTSAATNLNAGSTPSTTATKTGSAAAHLVSKQMVASALVISLGLLLA